MAIDTTPEARAAIREIFARMTGDQRVAAAIEMSEQAKQVSLSGIRARNPGFDDAQVKRAWFVLLHGEALTTKVLGPPDSDS